MTLYHGKGRAGGPETKVFATVQTPGDPSKNWLTWAYVDSGGVLHVVLNEHADHDVWIAWLLLE